MAHPPRPVARPLPPSRARAILRPLLMLMVFVSLGAGMVGGLLRLGIIVPLTANSVWSASSAVVHGALMTSGFLGTVVSLERAVALKARYAYLVPLASGLAGICLVVGQIRLGAGLSVLAAGVFIVVNIALVRRQSVDHTWLLLVSAVAWLAGNSLFAAGRGSGEALVWWFAFLVITIAAERLEMTRLMRYHPGAGWSLYAIIALLLGSAAWASVSSQTGYAVYGIALALLALWLATFDIAKRTVRARGLPRYMAACLLSGYAWLGVSGIAWTASALGLPLRDMAMHALGLGFIFSMIMGHAPVILPAVARIKLQYHPVFYVPLAALHLSLLLRLLGGIQEWAPRAIGASLNAVAILLFAATMARAALVWRKRYGPRPGAAPVRPGRQRLTP